MEYEIRFIGGNVIRGESASYTIDDNIISFLGGGEVVNGMFIQTYTNLIVNLSHVEYVILEYGELPETTGE